MIKGYYMSLDYASGLDKFCYEKYGVGYITYHDLSTTTYDDVIKLLKDYDNSLRK